ECLERLFSGCGKVEAVHLHKNPGDTPSDTKRTSEFFSSHKDAFVKWCDAYRKQCPKLKLLQREIDDYMTEFDSKVEQDRQAAREAEGVPDDEGWVTELLNFYSFQMRETKREHITQLRQKFEEDKRRVADMRAARKFRPY
ncbi:hypothetical protein NP493_245g02015, partial [Ridgeia piscesae]